MSTTSAAVSHALPDLTRADVGTVVVSQIDVGTPERQRLLVDANLEAWATLPWPDRLVSMNWLFSLDGTGVLAYAQWTGDAPLDDFARTHRPSLAAAVQRALPGLARVEPVPYRLYRSGVRDNAPAPGCIVIVSVEFEGPDEGRQRAWIDTVFDALASEATPHPGGISGHFHASLDGTRVLNYAEWVDEASHREALAGSGRGAVGSSPKWTEVQTYPGLKSSTVTRYRFDRGLRAAGALQTA